MSWFDRIVLLLTGLTAIYALWYFYKRYQKEPPLFSSPSPWPRPSTRPIVINSKRRLRRPAPSASASPSCQGLWPRPTAAFLWPITKTTASTTRPDYERFRAGTTNRGPGSFSPVAPAYRRWRQPMPTGGSRWSSARTATRL